MITVPSGNHYKSCLVELANGRHLEIEDGTTKTSELTYHQLQIWLQSLQIDEDDNLVISMDSLRLLPQLLPYELLGPIIIAALDSINSHTAPPGIKQDSKTLLHSMHKQQQPLQLGLKLVSLDLQEPAAKPLQTCIAAYSNLRQLSLQDLNIDVTVAQQLGQLASSTCAGNHLKQLCLHTVFMCESAWRVLLQGLQQGCDLQVLRLVNCLSSSSITLLAATVPAGCQQLRELDLSQNSLSSTSLRDQCHGGRDASTNQVSAAAAGIDQAWETLFKGLLTGRNQQLSKLYLDRCFMGPSAAAALAKVLKRPQEGGITVLSLANCTSLSTMELEQLVSAAAVSKALKCLDLTGSGLTDAALRTLLTPCSMVSGMLRTVAGKDSTACHQLTQLQLGSNRVTAAAVMQLTKQMVTTGRLSRLVKLQLAGCAAVGDTGAMALATVLQQGLCRSLQCLDLSGCEITDDGAAALAQAISGSTADGHTTSSSHCQGWGVKHLAAAAGSCHVSDGWLEELMLADNHITAAGIAALASAVSQSSCRLLLLDVSYNFVTPQGMRPLISAAAATATPTEGESITTTPVSSYVQHQQQLQQHYRRHKLTVLHECSTEFWRVQAAKQAADQHLAEQDVSQGILGTDPLCFEASTQLHDASDSNDSSGWNSRNSCCVGSLRSLAACSPSINSISQVHAKLAATAERTAQMLPASSTSSRSPGSPAVWHVMFNTLYQPDDDTSASHNSGPLIPVGVVDEDSEICRHYADSVDEVCSSCTEDAYSCCSGSDHSSTPQQRQQQSCGARSVVPKVLLFESHEQFRGTAVGSEAARIDGSPPEQIAARAATSKNSNISSVESILTSSTALGSGGCDTAAARSGTDQAVVPAAGDAAAMARVMPEAAAAGPTSACASDLPDAVRRRDITTVNTNTVTAAAVVCLDSPQKKPLPLHLPHPPVQPNSSSSSKRGIGRASIAVTAGAPSKDPQQLSLAHWVFPAAAKERISKAPAAVQVAQTAAAGSEACQLGPTSTRSQRSRVPGGTTFLP